MVSPCGLYPTSDGGEDDGDSGGGGGDSGVLAVVMVRVRCPAFNCWRWLIHYAIKNAMKSYACLWYVSPYYEPREVMLLSEISFHAEYYLCEMNGSTWRSLYKSTCYLRTGYKIEDGKIIPDNHGGGTAAVVMMAITTMVAMIITIMVVMVVMVVMIITIIVVMAARVLGVNGRRKFTTY
ncbi:Uncharacterised protein [Edwardsiella tarda]|nr:Uncharacterised protein [Edwardsiella tarda]